MPRSPQPRLYQSREQRGRLFRNCNVARPLPQIESPPEDSPDSGSGPGKRPRDQLAMRDGGPLSAALGSEFCIGGRFSLTGCTRFDLKSFIFQNECASSIITMTPSITVPNA